MSAPMRERGPQAPAGWLPDDAFPARRLLLATRLSARLRGLLFSPESEDVMVLLPCRDIHTFGMRYAIDVAFLDASGRVCAVRRDFMPNKRLREERAVAVLERCAMPGEVWFEVGERVTLAPFKRVGHSPMGRPDAGASRYEVRRSA